VAVVYVQVLILLTDFFFNFETTLSLIELHVTASLRGVAPIDAFQSLLEHAMAFDGSSELQALASTGLLVLAAANPEVSSSALYCACSGKRDLFEAVFFLSCPQGWKL
jgi:hypothetical protein